MYKYYILSILFLISQLNFGQCPTGNLVFNTQSEIDSFASIYPGCTELNVDIQINGSGITNLSGLSQVNAMNGELRIFDTSITTLGSLGTFNFFGSNSGLYISGNLNLTSLGNLTGELNRPDATGLLLKDLPGISSLNELAGITLISSFWLENMPGLATLSGLENTAITGIFLLIRNNDNLTDLTALSGNLGSFNGLTISDNDSLITLNGLNGIEMMDNGIASSFLNLTNNAVLTNLDALNSITFLPKNFRVVGNTQLPNLMGFSNMTGTAETVDIYENDTLQDLVGLEGINNVINQFTIRLNDNLLSLDGLQGLQNTGNNPALWVWLGENPLLTDISALNNLNPNSVSFCQFENNTNLSACATQFTCAALDAGVPFTLTNNASGCNSISEIEQACVLNINDQKSLYEVKIFPNPVSETLTITLPEELQYKNVIIFSSLGEKLINTSEIIIEVSNLSNGIYFISIETDHGMICKKFVKE